ncbi:uncharacterized protein LOC124257553 isoform X1 [Haliotis rubra]|uniref:uncharacterized protein LOC124257553 isoform X1 n=1 Tax=Haliotis rubra TaxID=36100 RepID=UPI001EE59D67|nr:uncharacterized protein LOC124257553 isoform X1 [Haliotis rubra]
MADWVADDTGVYENDHFFSRSSSTSSGRSSEGASGRRDHRFKADENENLDRTSIGSGASASSSERGISLSGGRQLTEESLTDRYSGISTNGSAPRIPPKDSIITGKMKKPAPSVPSIVTSPVDSIPEEDITIPNDGCLHNFTADEMATFFRYMRVEDRLINHMHRKGLDGKKFSRLKESEMDGLGLNNPIIRYFKEKSVKRTKGRMPFLL